MVNALPFEVSRDGGEGETSAPVLGLFPKMLWFARKLLKDTIHFTSEVETQNGHSSN